MNSTYLWEVTVRTRTRLGSYESLDLRVVAETGEDAIALSKKNVMERTSATTHQPLYANVSTLALKLVCVVDGVSE